MAPLFGLILPDGNLHFRSLFAHVNVLRHLKFDLDANVSCNVGRWVREGDIAEALLNSQDWPHGPLGSLLALLRELVHLEVDDAANNEIVLDFVRGQVIVASPESSKHDLSAGLFLRQLAHVVSKLDVVTVLIAG